MDTMRIGPAMSCSKFPAIVDVMVIYQLDGDGQLFVELSSLHCEIKNQKILFAVHWSGKPEIGVTKPGSTF